MERLNYFNPYQSKTGYHEDQLTRAYLVLLKHSFHAFAIFFDYCRSKHEVVTDREEKPILLNNLLEQGWEIDTQKGNPVIGTNWLLSVLITDAELKTNNGQIAASDRNAIYDGIISFGTNLTIIIENKPRSGNVWFGQLSPSRENLAEETKVYCNAAHLEWKEIIRQLNHLLNIPTISGYEKMMIEDFLSFIDQNFPYLNPFDSFHLCKGYPELIYRRIQNILKSIVLNEEVVKYHHGWGFYIETPYREIKEIGLIHGKKENEWWLELSFYFGNTQTQARAFYASNPTTDHLSGDWWLDIDFHVAYQSSNLVWFKNAPDTTQYINFWKENVEEIYQQPKEKVQEYIDWLKEENVLVISAEEEEKLQTKFFNTRMPVLNICPGLGAIYTITDKEAEEFDKKDELRKMILDAIKDGLKIIGKDGSEFLKQL